MPDISLRRDLEPSQDFGKWRLESKIGEGGNGAVWLATSRDGKSAVKFLLPEFIGGQREQRFRDEISFLISEKDRPGILPIIDHCAPENLGAHERLWFATPLATCFMNLDLSGSANFEMLVGHIATIARTLVLLHAENKYHRDLKPENLFLLDGTPVIGDFGLVDFPEKTPNTRSSENLGSRNYTAPELEGMGADVPAGPADVYSLAKTLWVLATGRPPPQGVLEMDKPELRLSRQCPHARAQALDIFLERCTQHNAASRPSMREFLSELRAWLEQPRIDAGGATPIITKVHESVFELASRENRKRDALISAARSTLLSFDPTLTEVVKEVSAVTRVSATLGYASHLERQRFVELAGGLRIVSSDAREVRVTVGEQWAQHLQTFVQVEAISDGSIRVVAGHFVYTTANGQRFARGTNEVWKKEARGPERSISLDNEIRAIRSELLANVSAAITAFGDSLIGLQRRK